MHVSVKTGQPESVSTDCLIVGVHEGGKLSAAAQAVDKASHGAVKAMFKSGYIKGKVGQTVMLHRPAGLACDRLLLVGCGKNDAMDVAAYHKVVKAALTAVRGTAGKEAFFCLGELEVTGRDVAWKARLCAEVAAGLSYRYDQTKSKKETDLPPLTKLQWWVAYAAEGRAAKRGIEEGTAIPAGMKLAKDLGNLPGNICTPTYLGEQAKALGHHYKNIKVTVLGYADEGPALSRATLPSGALWVGRSGGCLVAVGGKLSREQAESLLAALVKRTGVACDSMR